MEGVGGRPEPFLSILCALTAAESLSAPCCRAAPARIAGSQVGPPARSSGPRLFMIRAPHIVRSRRAPNTTIALQEALTFFARRVGGGSTAAPRSPTEEEPGKGEGAAGSDTRNNREEEPLRRQHWEGCERWLLSSSVEPGKFLKSWERSPLPHKQTKQLLNFNLKSNFNNLSAKANFCVNCVQN